MNRFFNLPLQKKIVGIYMGANILIFIVNIFLIFGINIMAQEMEMVYHDNRQLNALSEAIADVQDSMTGYLSSKTTDSLENYYNSAQKFQNLSEAIGVQVTDESFSRMRRNIKYMSENYLSEVSLTIEAKRGRNVEKYRNHYEKSTELYDYINAYISSLNIEQFVSNSEHYTELASAFRTFELVSVAVLTLVMIGNIISIIIIVGMLIRPLKDLADSADEVATGNFDTDLPEPLYHDEIGIVIGAFNKMVVSIKEYIVRLRESMEKERDLQEKELMMETHLKDAQLKYLQAQINPHFLFNTLNAGAQLAMMEGADKTYEYVQTVADFFRYNVKNQETEVTIKEEVTLVDNYIQILNVRFSGDIKYEKQVDKRLLKTAMPSMTLQPIVENAVNHGIREMGDKGVIKLKVYREDSNVCISIGDNGKGISQEDIDKILGGSFAHKEEQYEHNGIGMDNVISRLRLFSERPDVVDIKSEGPGKGCEVIIRLPLPADE
ncbi:sensor histidine kinase [Butyrivibrio sp. AE3006]|jgi:sensor histidine kinase YesM|uniref:sensor histidine kinase n=1 Tax=Butyrivibrio sp. AE3006 TaxID=1280673 RepID=UPI0003F6C424|nr:histidine kinase [Butyrivibrio sp. AE3006]